VHPLQRALLVGLDRWVSEGVEPPPSRYPRIDAGELIPAAEHKARFPRIPGLRHPGRNLQPPRVDYGDGFWTSGIFTVVPPRPGTPYPTRVPAFDEDGNGIGGIRLPELEVPLGTYQGWNPRRAEFGAPDFLMRFDGSFWAFPRTEADGRRVVDPRPAVEARYPTKADYVARVEAAVRRLVEERFLLPDDAGAYIAGARRMAWPPKPIDGEPYWRLE
jgi:hypothetical protein